MYKLLLRDRFDSDLYREYKVQNKLLLKIQTKEWIYCEYGEDER